MTVEEARDFLASMAAVDERDRAERVARQAKNRAEYLRAHADKQARKEKKAIAHAARTEAERKRRALKTAIRAKREDTRQKKADRATTQRLHGLDPEVMAVMRTQARKRAAPWEGTGNRD